MEIKCQYSENLPTDQYKTHCWAVELTREIPPTEDPVTAAATLFKVAAACVKAEVKKGMVGPIRAVHIQLRCRGRFRAGIAAEHTETHHVVLKAMGNLDAMWKANHAARSQHRETPVKEHGWWYYSDAGRSVKAGQVVETSPEKFVLNRLVAI